MGIYKLNKSIVKYASMRCKLSTHLSELRILCTCETIKFYTCKYFIRRLYSK